MVDRARKRDGAGDLIRDCKYTTTAKLNDIKTRVPWRGQSFFQRLISQNAAANVHGRETSSSDLALIAFLSWRSQKKILSDLIRQKRGVGPGAPKPTGIGPTARRAGRNHSSADLLLLISIKFNPARLAVGGAFTSCNSCLPLWSFSRGMPTLYQNARLWTLHYISRHETNKETHINKWTRDIERYRATAVLRDGNVAPSDRTLLLHLLSLLVSRYKACREFVYE